MVSHACVGPRWPRRPGGICIAASVEKQQFRQLYRRAQTRQRKRSASNATIERGTSPPTTARKGEGNGEDQIFPHTGANCTRARAMRARPRAAGSTQPTQRAMQSCTMPPSCAHTARPRRAFPAPAIRIWSRLCASFGHLEPDSGSKCHHDPGKPQTRGPASPRARRRPWGAGHDQQRGCNHCQFARASQKPALYVQLAPSMALSVGSSSRMHLQTTTAVGV